MRIALVHDWLNRRIGGGERVLLEFARLYPDAPVYTLLYDPAVYQQHLGASRAVHTSYLQRLPAALRERPRYLLPLIPMAVEQWDLSGYDVVLSSSVAFTKNILTPPRTLHVCYCHAPMRFAWDYWPQYLEELHAGAVKTFAVRTMINRLRTWDRVGVSRVDSWLCNSATTRERIRKYYGVDAPVLHPPVPTSGLGPPPTGTQRTGHITLSTLTEYKRVDLAIRAFTAAGLPLTVVGDGPDRARLERLAGPTVRFAGHVSDAERVRLLQHAEGLIVANEEDFGISPVEALACATPVIAYGRGGVLETVEEGRTGAFFAEPTAEALLDAVRRSGGTAYDPEDLLAAAARFSSSHFRAEVATAVEDAWAEHCRAGRA